MIQVDVSPEAAAELVALADYLSDFSSDAALRFVDTYDRVVADLREFPDLGRASLADPRVRELPRGRFVFVYERGESLVTLLHIFDGRRLH